MTRCPKGLFIPLFVCALAAQPVVARENHNDVFARALAPFIGVLAIESKSPQRALRAELTLIEAKGLSDGMKGARVGLAIERPDKLVLRARAAEGALAFCRDGQKVWAFPGGKASELLAAVKPAAKAGEKLPPLGIAIPAKQLVYLPALFQVRDAADDTFKDRPCRILDVSLMPELVKLSDGRDLSMRVWVDAANYKLLQIEIHRADWQATVSVDRLDFVNTLVAETWRPYANEAEDVAQIPPGRLNDLIAVLFGAKRER